jgi:hypothetical protein
MYKMCVHGPAWRVVNMSSKYGMWPTRDTGQSRVEALWPTFLPGCEQFTRPAASHHRVAFRCWIMSLLIKGAMVAMENGVDVSCCLSSLNTWKSWQILTPATRFPI